VNSSTRVLLAVVAASLVAACAGTGKPRPAKIENEAFAPDTSGDIVYLEETPATRRAVVTKNYAIGERRVSTVGEPMVGVRNYTAADRVVGAVALMDFAQLCRTPKEGETDLAPLVCRSGRLSALRGSARERFDVAGAFMEAGKSYYLVKIPGSGGSIYLAVDTGGRVKNGRYAAWAPDDVEKTPAGIPLRWQDTPTPLVLGAPLFRFETDEAVAADSANFVHYEILYRGTTYDYRGMVYHLLYREYRRENPSLPLYEQDLEFSSSVNTVDVLGLRMRVHDVNESQIVYTVLMD
jgi:hypothetical protein